MGTVLVPVLLVTRSTSHRCPMGMSAARPAVHSARMSAAMASAVTAQDDDKASGFQVISGVTWPP